MSIKAYYPKMEIDKEKRGFSKTYPIIEANFNYDDLVKVSTLKEAYRLAKNSPGIIVVDMPVYDGDTPVIGVFLLTEDSTFPPVIKVKDANLASVKGVTLSIEGRYTDHNELKINSESIRVQPYISSFKDKPSANDYEKFKSLIETSGVEYYVVNTGDFMGRKVQSDDILIMLEAIIEGTAKFKLWYPFTDIEILDWNSFMPNMKDDGYIHQLKERLLERLYFIKSRDTFKDGYDYLPKDALKAIIKLVKELDKL